jgi:DNA-binding MarR family transcriptional regulator
MARPTAPQRILRALLEAGGEELFSAQIAQRTGLAPGTTSATLRRLEDEGLVRSRSSDHDPGPDEAGEPRLRLVRRYSALTPDGVRAAQPLADRHPAAPGVLPWAVPPSRLVLQALLDHPSGNAYVTELAHMIGTSGGHVSTILTRLEADGLIVTYAARPGTPRRRRRHAALTDAGRALALARPPRERQALRDLMAARTRG